MLTTFQAPPGAAVLFCTRPTLSGIACDRSRKIQTKLRQNADKIAIVILLVILHQQLTTLTR